MKKETKRKIPRDIEAIKAQMDEIVHAPYSYHVGKSISSRKRHERDTAIYITQGDEPVVVMEITTQDDWYSDDEVLFMEEARAAGYSYGMMCCADWNEIWMQDLRESRKESSCYAALSSLDDLKDVLYNDTTDKPGQLDWKMGMQSVIDSSKKQILTSFMRDAIETLQSAHVTFDEATKQCYVSPKDEHAFFKGIFIQYDADYICRYTTYEALERILRERKQSVCSIVCMNDETECYYADEYLAKREKSKAKKTVAIDYEELNKCQISSCTHIELADKLAMWRMYGDDGKGVCLKFKVDNKMLSDKGFYLYCVNYAHEEDEQQWMLDMVALLRKLKVRGYKFEFTTWYIWKHFFKPSHYWDEKEVRLLYFCKEGTDKYKWIKAGDSQILAPVIEFGIEKGNNEFPLVLSEIILGPKFPEAATNAAQIKYFKALQQIEEDGDCPVTLSKIKGYR